MPWNQKIIFMKRHSDSIQVISILKSKKVIYQDHFYLFILFLLAWLQIEMLSGF